MAACCWLLQHGYEVFRNVSAHGTVNVVAMKGGEMLLIDVKSVSACEMKGGSLCATVGRSQDAEIPIKRLYVVTDGFCTFDRDEVFFPRHWAEGHASPWESATGQWNLRRQNPCSQHLDCIQWTFGGFSTVKKRASGSEDPMSPSVSHQEWPWKPFKVGWMRSSGPSGCGVPPAISSTSTGSVGAFAFIRVSRDVFSTNRPIG